MGKGEREAGGGGREAGGGRGWGRKYKNRMTNYSTKLKYTQYKGIHNTNLSERGITGHTKSLTRQVANMYGVRHEQAEARRNRR